jgi:ribosomal protein L14E/L6E/L27E
VSQLNEDLQLGQIVRSKAGRDRGKWFAVVGLEGDAFVYLADGKTRSTENPNSKRSGTSQKPTAFHRRYPKRCVIMQRYRMNL